jgi:hypothetical protein
MSQSASLIRCNLPRLAESPQGTDPLPGMPRTATMSGMPMNAQRAKPCGGNWNVFANVLANVW